MSLGKKKTVLISAGVVLLGTAAYGSLLWWQLQTFDKMGEDLSVRNMGFFALEQERLGGDWLHRDLALRLGFREDDGLSEVFLEMKGRFTPGLFPTIRFTAVPVDDPERAIFVKTNPQASIGFSPLMVPKDAEIRWTKATEGHDVVSDGRIAAKLDVDTAKKVLKGFAVNGRLGASESQWDGGKIYIAEKTFDYVYKESPRTLDFSYVSGGDKVEGDMAPIVVGPFEYKLSIKPKEEGDFKGNLTDVAFKAKALALNDEGLPPLDMSFDGSFLTPADVWLPCLSAQLFVGSVASDVPGICPADTAKDPLAAIGTGAINGEIRDFVLSWPGTALHVKGSVINKALPQANFEVTAHLSDVTKKDDVPLAAVMLSRDVKRYVEDLQEEGAVNKTGEHDYQTTLAFGLTPEGVLTMTANGQDITKLKASFEVTSPLMNQNVILITVTPLTEPYVSKGVDGDVIAPLEKVLTGLEAVKRWSTIQGDDKSHVLQIVVEEPDKATEVIKVLDERLTKLKEVVGSGVDLEMQISPYVDPGVQFE